MIIELILFVLVIVKKIKCLMNFLQVKKRLTLFIKEKSGFYDYAVDENNIYYFIVEN